MARRINAITTFTPAAVADTTTFTAGQAFAFWLGGSGTQQTYFWEISLSGQAGSTSSPTFMLLSRDSTVGSVYVSGTGQTDAAIAPATAALAATVAVGNGATTFGQRSSSLHLQNCSLNAFGGVYFWRANRLEEAPTMLGNTATIGEASLSAFTGGTVGLIGGHVIYETL